MSVEADVELFALAVLAFCHGVEVLSANQDRESQGVASAYNGCFAPEITELHKRLSDRGTL